MSLSAGTRLGPYEVLAPLGAGGMGEVYRARDTRLAREVAVKVLPADFSADEDRLRRFEREARAASALNHPNIITVHDIANDSGVKGDEIAACAAKPETKAHVDASIALGNCIRKLGFDWAVEFAEIFMPRIGETWRIDDLHPLLNDFKSQPTLVEEPETEDGGFDIVVANPPYVRADAQFKHIKKEKERHTFAAWILFPDLIHDRQSVIV